jgi:hypothetical protein
MVEMSIYRGDNLKKKYVSAIFIAFLCLTSFAYAAYMIFGNIVGVNCLEYSFGTMTVDKTEVDRYQNVTFTGQLLHGAAGSTGKTVLLMNNNTGSWTQVASTITNATGHFYFTMNITEAGMNYFKPGFDTP